MATTPSRHVQRRVARPRNAPAKARTYRFVDSCAHRLRQFIIPVMPSHWCAWCGEPVEVGVIVAGAVIYHEFCGSAALACCVARH